jgi:hypothetical protein
MVVSKEGYGDGLIETALLDKFYFHASSPESCLLITDHVYTDIYIIPSRLQHIFS